MSPIGEAMLLSQIMRSEGHDVVYYIHDESSREIGNGLVWKTDDPDSAAEQADLIIFDDNGMGKKADEYRKKGYDVWNGGSVNDDLEHDRNLGMRVFRKCGIPIPETSDVSSVKEVENAISKIGSSKCVVKLDGSDKAGSSFTFVADDGDQLLAQVTHWVDDGLLKKGWSGIVQEFIPGIEVSIEGWFCEGRWSNLNITLEEKKALSGGLGQSVGCAFNTIVSVSEKSKLFKKVLLPLTEFLAKAHFVGQIDTNSIVDKDGIPRALEFTPRIGYDSTPTLAWGRGRFVTDIQNALGDETAFRNGDMDRGRYWCGVSVSIPPYPLDIEDKKLCDAVYEQAHGVPVEIGEGLDFYYRDLAHDSETGLYCAGTYGIIGLALGGGDSVREAARHAYSVADKVKVPNKGYRALDGHKRGEDAIAELLDMDLIRLA